jgi:multisubunit Na+/H+ antiporter MnhC subunit
MKKNNRCMGQFPLICQILTNDNCTSFKPIRSYQERKDDMRCIIKSRSVLLFFVFIWVTNICFSSVAHSASDRNDVENAQALSNALMVGAIVCAVLAVALALSSRTNEALSITPESRSSAWRPLISIRDDSYNRQQDLIFGFSIDF